jgi:hypothetical protein
MTLSTALRARLLHRIGRMTSAGAALLCVACAPSTESPFAPPADARLTGRLGDQAFVAHATAFVKQVPGVPDSLYVFAQQPLAPNGGAELSLRLRLAYAGAGTYSLGDREVELMHILGGDQVIGHLLGDPTRPGHLSITASDDVLTGTLAFALADSPNWRTLPPPTAFTAGMITVRLSAWSPVAARRR